MLFKAIKKTQHYIDFHERDVPWSEVIKIIFETKNMRKRGDKIQIETNKYYILLKVENRIAYVINAKRK